MDFHCFRGLASLIHPVLTAVSLAFHVPPEPTVFVGMTHEEVQHALGWPFLEHYRSFQLPDRRPEVMYAPEGTDWRGYRIMVIVSYAEDGGATGWKVIDLPPDRPAWLNSILYPIGL